MKAPFKIQNDVHLHSVFSVPASEQQETKFFHSARNYAAGLSRKRVDLHTVAAHSYSVVRSLEYLTRANAGE